MRIITLILTTLLFSSPAFALKFLCKAKALKNVPVYDISPDEEYPVFDNSSWGRSLALRRGSYLTDITVYTKDKRDDSTRLCQYKGSCYPTHLIKNGKKTEVLTLLNCKIGKQFDDNKSDTSYYLDIINAKNSKHDLMVDELQTKLLDMGFCNACTDAVIDTYLKTPSSDCRKLVDQSLAGNKSAIYKLQSDSKYCGNSPQK